VAARGESTLLERVMRGGAPSELRWSADMRAASAADLHRLSRKRRWDVRATVARNPGCPPEARARLAGDPEWAVRAAVAGCPEAEVEVLRGLAVDIPPVRLELAGNRAAPTDVVVALLGDTDPWVAGLALGNPGAPPELLVEACRELSAPPWALRLAAVNPSCPADEADEVLTWLALGGAAGADPTFDPRTCKVPPWPTDFGSVPWPHVERLRDPGAALTHALWPVRLAAWEPELAKPVREQLARDAHAVVRERVALDPGIPRRLLAELVDDADVDTAAVAQAAAAQRNGAVARAALGPHWASYVVLMTAVIVGGGALLATDDRGTSSGGVVQPAGGFQVEAMALVADGREAVVVQLVGVDDLTTVDFDLTGVLPDGTLDHIDARPGTFQASSGVAILLVDDAGWSSIRATATSADGRVLDDTTTIVRTGGPS
jgi:hypothetical protein